MDPRPASPPRTDARRYLAQLVLTVVVTGAVLLPGYIEAFPEHVFGEGYARWRAPLEFASRPGPDPEVLIVGDSRGQAAILPERLDAEAWSLALAGGTAIEAAHLLDRYLEHHAPPRVLVVSLAPFHLERAEVFWDWTVKWKALRPGELREVFARAEALGDGVLGEPDARALSRRSARLRLNTVFDYAPELRESALGLRHLGHARRTEALRAAQGHGYYGTDASSSALNQETTDEDGFRASPLLGAYLDDVLDRATGLGARVVFAAMPVNHSSWRAIGPDYKADYHRHVARLAERHPEVVFRGFLWTLPDDHFGDKSHVNERGARLVTDWLAPLL